MGLFTSPLLLFGLFVVAFIKLLTLLRPIQVKSRNPFENVKIKPVKPKVTDRKLRDAVLKQSECNIFY